MIQKIDFKQRVILKINDVARIFAFLKISYEIPRKKSWHFYPISLILPRNWW